MIIVKNANSYVVIYIMGKFKLKFKCHLNFFRSVEGI